MSVSVTLIGKPECHLCDDARAAVVGVIGQLESQRSRKRDHEIRFDELNILDDAELAEIHGEYIPVVLINGKRHAFWRVDEAKFERALEKAVKRRLFQ